MGGGFATNILLAHFGHSVRPLPAGADIDFYMYSPDTNAHHATYDPISDSLFADPELALRDELSRFAAARKQAALQQFIDFLRETGGYKVASPPDLRDYQVEPSVRGDRFLTSGSTITYSVLYLRRTIPWNGTTQSINLVIVNEPIHTVMTKVDISLTAGFITGSPSDVWIYHHAAPADLAAFRLRWMQQQSTHTPRQIARLEKYCARYSILPSYIFTPDEFIEAFDTLPDQCILHIECRADDAPPPVRRRILGLPEAIVHFQQ